MGGRSAGLLSPANVARRQDGLMERLPESLERRHSELAELFGPEQAAYGESYRERLREDEEVSARVRERFERGKASGKYPALSAYLSNLTDKEKEIFFKTQYGPQLLGPHALVPEDVGVRFRQLNYNSIWRIEAGRTGAKPRTVRRLATALGVKPYELLKRDNNG